MRFEYIDTTMNPLKLAAAYRQHGWNVVIVDEEGVRRSGLDLAHSIACDVLGVSCENGWIVGLEKEFSRLPHAYEFNGLDEGDKRDLEELFFLRDCCYETDFELEKGTHGFRIVNQHAVWKDCRNKCDLVMREQITDTNFFLNILQSQKDCESEFADLSDILKSTTFTSSKDGAQQIILTLTVFIGSVLGFLVIRRRCGKNSRKEFDGLFRDKAFWGNSMPPDILFPEHESANSKTLCNACKFVRVDPNCIFCHNVRRLVTSEIGKEVERRIKQHQRVTSDGFGNEINDDREMRSRLSGNPASHFQPAPGMNFGLAFASTDIDIESSSAADLNQLRPVKNRGTYTIDTSHFDMNLRNTKSQSKKKRKNKKKQEKSKVVRKLKELLVLKTESGETVYKVEEQNNNSSGDNLQTTVFDEDDNLHA